MTYFQAILLAIVEGLTEFLPISSTGHLILTAAAFNIQEDAFVKNYNVIIQVGAILSVLVIYWRRFLPNLAFYKKVVIACVPAIALGLGLKDHIDAILGSVWIVAIALILGGIILIWMDKVIARGELSSTKTVDTLSLMDCLKIGLFQCLAFVPGVSRSAATILGGLYLKMSRKEAAEFSFFLAVPVLAGATLLKSYKLLPTITPDQIHLLFIGGAVAFAIAWIAIKSFIALVSRIGFSIFGYYRILLGCAVISILLWERI